MEEKTLLNLHQRGFLSKSDSAYENLFHLATPCCFQIVESVVKELRNAYKHNEEIGGVLWIKPEVENEEKIFKVEKMTLCRNAIEDQPRTDGYNRSNAFLFDTEELENAFDQIFQADHLPVKFHTHPNINPDNLAALSCQHLITETSKQDVRESSLTHKAGSKKLLMPRALIVGDQLGRDIFIGLYGGSIAPNNFVESKKKVQEENSGAQRIGHGVDIAYERNNYQLLNYMSRSHIAVEINLSGNEYILGIKNDAHPLMLYYRFHVPVVISTDELKWKPERCNL